MLEIDSSLFLRWNSPEELADVFGVDPLSAYFSNVGELPSELPVNGLER